MATRLLRYVGRTSGNPTATLSDGREVALGETAEVELREARSLLREAGANDDSGSEWVPAPRGSEEG